MDAAITDKDLIYFTLNDKKSGALSVLDIGMFLKEQVLYPDKLWGVRLMPEYSFAELICFPMCDWLFMTEFMI